MITLRRKLAHASAVAAVGVALAGAQFATAPTASAASCYGTLTGKPGSHSITYVASSGCLGQKMRAVVQCETFGNTHKGVWAFYGRESRASCSLFEGGVMNYYYEVAAGSAP